MSEGGHSRTDAVGDGPTELDLPESRAWADALRSPGFLWLLAFLAINYLALGVAMGAHGAGFDDCGATQASSDRALMAKVAVATVGISAALALWRVKGWALSAALGAVALSGAAWWVLLRDTQVC